jgi:peptide/nickel transport system substrate-binding protein
VGLLEVRRKRRVRWGVWLPVLAIICLASTACGLAVLSTWLSEEDSTEDAGLVYGLTLLPSGFDPHYNSSAELGIPLFSVYDTLIYRHPQTFAFEPGLAERWEVSPDGTIYTFYLKRNVQFHDGTPFNANAVGVTFDRVTNETMPGYRFGKARALLGPFYQGYAIIDDYTFQLQLTTPYAPLLDALSQPYWGIASPTALANTSPETYQWNQVGTGPYRMVKVVPGDRLILERNRDYVWEPPFYAALSDQSIDRITFRFFVEPATRRLALEAGDVSIVGELPPTDAEFLLGNQQFQLYKQPIPGQPLQFYFNTGKWPTDDVRVRQAVLFATNREAIVDAVFFRDFSPTAYGPLAAVTPFYDPAMRDLYVHNTQQARGLFLNAGFEDTDQDGILDQSGNPLKLKVVIAGWGFLPEVAQLLESQWREIGLEVEIMQVADFPTLREVAESGDYNLIAYNDFGTDPSLLNAYYLSDGANNWTGYGESELDTWLLQAVQTTDDDARARLYSLVQRRIMERALILPIRDYVNLVGWTNQLDGLIFTAQGWWPLLANLQERRPS